MKCITIPYVILYFLTKFDIYVFITGEKGLNRIAKIWSPMPEGGEHQL